MASIVLQLRSSGDIQAGRDEILERVSVGPHWVCGVVGKRGTYEVVSSGEDVVAAVGYASLASARSVRESLLRVLTSFDESRITDIKKELAGQYVLLVKKRQRVWVFADFLGARNVFYSDDGSVVSSSLGRVEDLLHTNPDDLDPYKVAEYLAVKHVLYPAWLGCTTAHKRIKLLYPYEYLTIDTATTGVKVGSLVFSLDNSKQGNCAILADELLSVLRSLVRCPEHVDAAVASTLSGGRDSRLVSGLASEYYKKVRFRIAVAPGHHDSQKDMEVARTIAKGEGIPLEVYCFQPGRDEMRFEEFTESMAPVFNNKLAPLLAGTGSYSLGFGGVFGTELFMPLPWSSIDEFVRAGTERARGALNVPEEFWGSFGEAMQEEFRRLKAHYVLTENNDRDYIRLFVLLDTARYASFIVSGFNHSGYQLEPFGTYAAFSVAIRVAPSLWGNHRRFGGDARVQLAAMAKLNPRMAGVLTYKNYRPMMPLSAATFRRYLWGVILQGRDVLRRRLERAPAESRKIEFGLGQYLGGDWADSFFRRLKEKYGMPFTEG